jgi:hypothetical protein
MGDGFAMNRLTRADDRFLPSAGPTMRRSIVFSWMRTPLTPIDRSFCQFSPRLRVISELSATEADRFTSKLLLYSAPNRVCRFSSEARNCHRPALRPRSAPRDGEEGRETAAGGPGRRLFRPAGPPRRENRCAPEQRAGVQAGGNPCSPRARTRIFPASARGPGPPRASRGPGAGCRDSGSSGPGTGAHCGRACATQSGTTNTHPSPKPAGAGPRPRAGGISGVGSEPQAVPPHRGPSPCCTGFQCSMYRMPQNVPSDLNHTPVKYEINCLKDGR